MGLGLFESVSECGGCSRLQLAGRVWSRGRRGAGGGGG